MRIFVQHTIIGITINQMIYTLVQRADGDMASWRILAVLIWWIFQYFPFTGCKEINCSFNILEVCKSQFDENSYPVCSEVTELQECLSTVRGCNINWVMQLTYRALEFKVQSYPGCKTGPQVRRKCNESLAQSCFNQFNAGAEDICSGVKELRNCIVQLKGCHVMRHPSYAMSQNVLSKYRRCFYVNYSRILDALKNQEPVTVNISTQGTTSTQPTTVAIISDTNTNSSYLPYAFVVVATVTTCLFLIIAIVFSIVRHMKSTRERRHTSLRVERTERLRECRDSSLSPCTRLHLINVYSQRRPCVIQNRQTLTGTFEGNVPPPPYMAALDDTESVRAGDPPPPYHAPSFIIVGEIV